MLYARLSDRRMHVPRGARDHACAVLVRFLYLRPLFSLFFFMLFSLLLSVLFVSAERLRLSLVFFSLFFLSRSLWLLLSPTLFGGLSSSRALSRTLSRARFTTRAHAFGMAGKLKCADPARPDPGVTSASSRRRHARGSAAKKRPTTCLRGATMATVTRGADVAGRPGHGGDRQPPTLQQGATHIPHAGGWRRY